MPLTQNSKSSDHRAVIVAAVLDKHLPTFSRCANPNCGAQFDYRKGAMVRVQCDHRLCCGVERHVFKHLWLCNACRNNYRFQYLAGGWFLVPIQPETMSQLSPGQQN